MKTINLISLLLLISLGGVMLLTACYVKPSEEEIAQQLELDSLAAVEAELDSIMEVQFKIINQYTSNGVEVTILEFDSTRYASFGNTLIPLNRRE